ncbi:hypothetical protein HaLaN_12179 [Haematococcus lacustris]|uniref:Uncharacterized protein n=1 Tax=Haematococcus lacustris TaxID=44745 RepID=A0A699Z026_HAELA|nr:hypothetical protein HaLaN_12179 [Haematococcus lacustris]
MNHVNQIAATEHLTVYVRTLSKHMSACMANGIALGRLAALDIHALKTHIWRQLSSSSREDRCRSSTGSECSGFEAYYRRFGIVRVQHRKTASARSTSLHRQTCDNTPHAAHHLPPRSVSCKHPAEMTLAPFARQRLDSSVWSWRMERQVPYMLSPIIKDTSLAVGLTYTCYCACMQTVGIANTVRRYAETRPVTLHHTPFEKRVEEELAVEGLVVAQASGLPSGRIMWRDSEARVNVTSHPHVVGKRCQATSPEILDFLRSATGEVGGAACTT